MKKSIYLVWNDVNWELYDLIEDAINCHGDNIEVYFAEPKLLGSFKLETKVIKSKAKKPK